MRKEQMVGSRLPPELIQDLELIEKTEQSDRSTTVRKLLYKATKDWKMEHFARLYAEGKVTIGRAAEEAGVSIWEMMEYFREKKIPSQYDLEEWLKDVETVERRLGSGRAQRKGAR